jgi:hypothetical protein
MLEPSPVQRNVKPWNANHGASMNNAHPPEVSGLTGLRFVAAFAPAKA